MLRFASWLLFSALALGGVVFRGVAEDPVKPPAVPLVSACLDHCFRITPTLVSGGQPEGEDAFAELALWGIRTLISVDGARPDIAAAHRHGLRYVHLPFGYDGVPSHRVAELVRAVSGMPGPVYVHCHHGRHRGPAAAAIVGMASGVWTASEAEAFLRQAGTAPEYPGLYRAVREFRMPDPAELGRVGELPEVAVTATVVEAMVALDGHLDRLKAAQRAGWPSRPELTGAATLLWEQLRELQREPAAAGKSPEYRDGLAASEHAALVLRDSLRPVDAGESPISPDEALKTLSQRCTACHKEFRN